MTSVRLCICRIYHTCILSTWTHSTTTCFRGRCKHSRYESSPSTCGCGPVLCMACMSPAVDSELYSKKAWYFYNGSKLEHHSSTLMKLQSRNWSCDHPPVISSAVIWYVPWFSSCFNNFLSFFYVLRWTLNLNTATAMSSQERSLFLFFIFIFCDFIANFPHVMSIFLVMVKGSHSPFRIYLRKEDS